MAFVPVSGAASVCCNPLATHCGKVSQAEYRNQPTGVTGQGTRELGSCIGFDPRPQACTLLAVNHQKPGLVPMHRDAAAARAWADSIKSEPAHEIAAVTTPTGLLVFYGRGEMTDVVIFDAYHDSDNIDEALAVLTLSSSGTRLMNEFR